MQNQVLHKLCGFFNMRNQQMPITTRHDHIVICVAKILASVTLDQMRCTTYDRGIDTRRNSLFGVLARLGWTDIHRVIS